MKKKFTTHFGFKFLAFKRWAKIRSKIRQSKGALKVESCSNNIARIPQGPPFECPKCFKVINSTRSNFVRHLNLHGNSERIMCDLCNKTYQNKSNFSIHISRKHPSEDFVPWSTTNEGFRSQPYYL